MFFSLNNANNQQLNYIERALLYDKYEGNYYLYFEASVKKEQFVEIENLT